VTDTAELLVSELVTNAVPATQALASPPFASSMHPVALRMVALRLRVTRGPRLCIEVWDVSDREPVARGARTLDEGGRGLALASAVVDRLDYERAGDENQWVLERVRH